jgi:hypothetical protein
VDNTLTHSPMIIGTSGKACRIKAMSFSIALISSFVPQIVFPNAPSIKSSVLWSASHPAARDLLTRRIIMVLNPPRILPISNGPLKPLYCLAGLASQSHQRQHSLFIETSSLRYRIHKHLVEMIDQICVCSSITFWLTHRFECDRRGTAAELICNLTPYRRELLLDRGDIRRIGKIEPVPAIVVNVHNGMQSAEGNLIDNLGDAGKKLIVDVVLRGGPNLRRPCYCILMSVAARLVRLEHYQVL